MAFSLSWYFELMPDWGLVLLVIECGLGFVFAVRFLIYYYYFLVLIESIRLLVVTCWQFF